MKLFARFQSVFDMLFARFQSVFDMLFARFQSNYGAKVLKIFEMYK